MTSKIKNRVIAACLLSAAAISAVFFTKVTIAQSNTNTLSGVFGCTMRDDRWGRAPEIGRGYDVSGLVWILDATRNKISGMDFEYEFASGNTGLGTLNRQEPVVYKDESIAIEATDLMNVFKMTAGQDGPWYIVSTNGGNTLFVTGVSSRTWVSESGICQKM